MCFDFQENYLLIVKSPLHFVESFKKDEYLTVSVEVIGSCSDLFAFFPNGTDNNDVTSRNENGRNDKNGQGDKCHVKLPLPLMIKIDPTLCAIVI